MHDKWKLWPNEYRYQIFGIIAGIIFIYFGLKFYIKQSMQNSSFFIYEKNLIDLFIMLWGICILLAGIFKNIKVKRLRKEIQNSLSNCLCYRGKIISIEHELTHNTKSDERHLDSYAIIDYTDSLGNSQKIISGTYIGALEAYLSDDYVQVYVDKQRQTFLFENFSWRQSLHDSFIQVKNSELSERQKNVKYFLVRYGEKILFGIILIIMLYVSVGF